MSDSLPFHNQEEEYTCVAACLRMAFEWLGLVVDEQEIFYHSGRDKRGTTPSNAVAAAKALGFSDCRLAYLTDLSALALERARGVVPIVYLRVPGGGPLPNDHAVVVAGIDEADVLVHDPSPEYDAAKKIPLAQFDQMWRGARRLALLVARNSSSEL